MLAVALAMTACREPETSTTATDAKRELQSPAGTRPLTGMYSYMADAGFFVDCATGDQWPVAMEEDNAALERAYGEAKSAPGAALLVSVEGRLEPRPRVDRPGLETALIVERFLATWPGETCGSPDAP